MRISLLPHDAFIHPEERKVIDETNDLLDEVGRLIDSLYKIQTSVRNSTEQWLQEKRNKRIGKLHETMGW